MDAHMNGPSELRNARSYVLQCWGKNSEMPHMQLFQGAFTGEKEQT